MSSSSISFLLGILSFAFDENISVHGLVVTYHYHFGGQKARFSALLSAEISSDKVSK